MEAGEFVHDQMTRDYMLSRIRKMQVSVTVADPNLYDCPLIGCSEGFETLTGYSLDEIVGQNCRFLNQQCNLNAKVRASLRDAIACRRDFAGEVTNRHRSRKPFKNLLHLTTIVVGGHDYILGVQADVTNLDIEAGSLVASHACEFHEITQRIAGMIVEEWAQCFQGRQEFLRTPLRFDNSHSQAGALGGFLTDEPSEDLTLEAGKIIMDHSTLKQLSLLFVPDMKSSGSAHHPDHCVECQFHFFALTGCSKGADCLYCHEMHPRKRKKKIRKVLRRFSAHEQTGLPQTASANMNGLDGDVENGIASSIDVKIYYNLQESFGTWESEGITHMECIPSVSCVVGFRMRLPLSVAVEDSQNEMLHVSMNFSVAPTLPDGMAIDPTTGLISGMPRVEAASTVYTITVRVFAKAEGGDVIGSLPLTTSRLCMRVVSEQQQVHADMASTRRSEDFLVTLSL